MVALERSFISHQYYTYTYTFLLFISSIHTFVCFFIFKLTVLQMHPKEGRNKLDFIFICNHCQNGQK